MNNLNYLKISGNSVATASELQLHLWELHRNNETGNKK